MPRNIITLKLQGQVSLDLFAKGVDSFRELVVALSAEVASGTRIQWLLDDLAPGSALISVRGTGGEPEAIERVVEAYRSVGRALASNSTIGHSKRVVRAARELTGLLNGHIGAIEFEVDGDVTTITKGSLAALPVTSGAYGALEGRIQTVSERRGIHFVLYDPLDDRPIECVPTPGMKEDLRNAWGRRALVAGWIVRDAPTGRPLRISPVASVTILEDVQPGAYRQAAGIAPLREGDLPAEEFVRQGREDVE